MIPEKRHVNAAFVLAFALSGAIWGLVIGLVFRHLHKVLRIF